MRYILIICSLLYLGCWGALGALAEPVTTEMPPPMLNGHILSIENIPRTEDCAKESPSTDCISAQYLEVQLSGGKDLPSEPVEILHQIPEDLPFRMVLKKGDRVVLHEELPGEYVIDGYRVEHVTWILLGIFLLLILLFGGKKGVFTIISLVMKAALLLFFLIPALKAGYSPVWMASIFCALATLLTLLWVSGLNRKTVAACLGAIGGVILAGLIGSWAVQAAHLTGLFETETANLHYQLPHLSIRALIAAGVLIGSLGATMDVAISVASSLHEIALIAPDKGFRELYRTGMNIGQDIMGTMVNTLILAYAGSALITIILISSLPLKMLLNTELIMKEIILAIVGSIGLILSIPLTAAISSYLYTRRARTTA